MENVTCRRVLIDHPPFLDLDAKRGWINQGIWPASWITHPSLPTAPCGLEFRLKVQVDGPDVINLRIHATGDERYELSLNGELIGWGSERGTIDHWYFDSYDLSLTSGEHWLTARVSAAGRYALRSQMSAGPGFLLASETPEFSTGEAPWEVRLLQGLRYEKPFDHDFFSVGWNTIQDASQMKTAPAELKEIWESAHLLEAGSTTGRRNRYPNIRLLTPATLPVTRRELFRGGRTRHVSSRLTGPITSTDHLASEHTVWEKWWHSGVAVTVPANQERRLLIDLEDYVCAWPQLGISGGHRAEVTARWAESLYEQEGTGRKGNRDAMEGKIFAGIGDTFLPDGGTHTFQGPFIRAGRYLQLTLKTGAEPLIVKSLCLIRAEYPLEISSDFSTNLASMQPLLERCRRTIRASCHDNLVDGPYYEQMGWIGDVPQVALSLYTMSRDARLVRKVLEVFDRSRLPGGMIRARWPARDSLFLPPYSLCWINVLHDFAWWRNEPDFVRDRLPGMRAILDGFLSWVDSRDGLLRIPTGWNFVDWVPGWPGGIPPIDADGSCSVFQWQLAWTLQQAAILEEHFGEPELVSRYHRHAQRIAQAAEIFWDDAKSLYTDNRTRSSFSEHTQAYAALSGLIPLAHLPSFKAALVRDENCTRATDPFSHYVFEAYGRLALKEHAWSRMKGWFEYEALGLLTTPEGPEPTRSDCHAWGAHPHYHLFASLLGLRPATPGFRSVQIDPLWDLLQNVTGVIPHPDGQISFQLSLVDGRPQGEISLPRGLNGKIIWPGGEQSLHEGKNRFGPAS